MPKKYDFAGWVTKHDVKCADGIIIKHGAFKTSENLTVPLVWNHNSANPTNIVGNMLLEHRDEGVYGYGRFNDSETGKHAKVMVEHGDITSMSIGARNLKKQGSNLLHGLIYEVSLVMAGANPEALILEHSDMDEIDEGKAIIFSGDLLHTTDDEILEHKKGDNDMEVSEKTIGDVMDTLNEEQTAAVEELVANILADSNEELEQALNQKEEKLLKHNVFDGTESIVGGVVASGSGTLSHSAMVSILEEAKRGGSLRKAFQNNEEVIQHGIENIEYLFPEAKNLTNEPIIYRDRNTGAEGIVNATTKSPFSKVRTRIADFTEEEARARGYIKGKQKKEQIFKILKRETGPQMIYKKQKLDREDIIDITDFDIVRFIEKEMRFMLIEELGRAILVGDGREDISEDKIKEENIRPVISDDDLYTIKATYTDAADFVESTILAMADYQGSGSPLCYIDPTLLAKVKLLKGTDGRFLFGHIPTNDAVAAMLGVGSMVPTTFMKGKGALIVNLADYSIGSTKGGELTTFDDFDIDFNQYKYLIETYLSGALTLPKSALYMGIDPGEIDPGDDLEG